MANIFQKLFGGGKKPTEYQGIKPFESLQEIPEIRLATKLSQARAQGQDVGFDRSVMDRNVAPYAIAQRTGFERYVAPQISASASARGVGRSTIPINIEARGRGEVESDIAQRIAQIELQNEQQKRAEIQNALGELYGYGSAEAGTRGQRAGFDYGAMQDFQNQQMAFGERQRAGLMKGAGLGASILAAPFTGGASLANIPSQLGGGSGNTSDIMDLLSLVKKAKEAAQVNK